MGVGGPEGRGGRSDRGDTASRGSRYILRRSLSLLGCPRADWSEVSLLVIYCKTTLPQTIVRPRVPVLGVVALNASSLPNRCTSRRRPTWARL